MKYIPKFNIVPLASEEPAKRELKQKMVGLVDDIYNLPRNPISDTTSFIVKSTTIDLSDIEDPKFKREMELQILSINKFAALSNLNSKDETLLEHMWQDLKFAIKFGYQKRAKTKCLEIIRLYNQSRGREGKFSMQLITTREELIARHKKDEEESKKKGFFGFRKPKEPAVEDMGVDGEFTK